MSANQSDPMTRHAAQPPAAPDVLQYFAITAAWASEKELALQQLEAGLRAPVASGMLSYGALKLFPFWDPLRGDPRFEKIVASLAPKDAASPTK
jgi:hypothetical protein